MSQSNNKKILIKMTGSIACFKVCELISKLVQDGFNVQVVASPSALQFVGKATLEGLSGNAVISDLWADGKAMDHIHLMRWADLVLVAPASANFINKASAGIADNLLNTMYLAHDFTKPYLVVPAMNSSMYLHPTTQESLKKISSVGIQVLHTESGNLACGEVGYGRMISPEEILVNLKRRLSSDLKNKKILVTSGGTQEPIDDVRVLTNKSTGSTGLIIVEKLVENGFDVTHLCASSSKPKYEFCKTHYFNEFSNFSTQFESLLKENHFDGVVHLAALSDFSVSKDSFKNGKISSDSNLELKFEKNPKLVNYIHEWSQNSDIKVIAFKMTSTTIVDEQIASIAKLFSSSQADVVVHNDVSEINWQTGNHTFHVCESTKQKLSLNSKSDLGKWISNYFSGDVL